MANRIEKLKTRYLELMEKHKKTYPASKPLPDYFQDREEMRKIAAKLDKLSPRV